MAWRVSGKGAGGFPARVAHALSRFHYTRLGTSDRCVARGFLSKATELSQAQMPRLVGQFTKSGHVLDGCGGAPRRPFERCQTAADIWPLAEADATAGTDGWTGDAQGHAVGVRGGRRHRLRAPGAHLERTLLQPAPVHNQQAPAHRPATPARAARAGPLRRQRARLVAAEVSQPTIRPQCPIPLRRLRRHMFVNLDAAVRSDAHGLHVHGRVSTPVGLAVHWRLPDPAPRASHPFAASPVTLTRGAVPCVSELEAAGASTNRCRAPSRERTQARAGSV